MREEDPTQRRGEFSLRAIEILLRDTTSEDNLLSAATAKKCALATSLETFLQREIKNIRCAIELERLFRKL